MHHFSWDGSSIQVYRIVGVATAAGEALPKPPGAWYLFIGVLFTEDFMKKSGAKTALFPPKKENSPKNESLMTPVGG